MKEVKVHTVELLTKVKSNLANHLQDYNESVEGYKEKVIVEFKKALTAAKNGQDVDFTVISKLMQKPQSYEKDYNRAIEMLSMSTESEITLSQHEFDQLVMDEWQWRAQVATLSGMYNNKKAIV